MAGFHHGTWKRSGNHRNYHDALANDLPIGFGEIESAHRYIAQQRLKRPGAWWRVDHAEYMLALRINRRNGDWVAYVRQNRLARKSEPTSRITKIRSVSASLWIAPLGSATVWPPAAQAQHPAMPVACSTRRPNGRTK
jgi:hypothetical protein